VVLHTGEIVCYIEFHYALFLYDLKNETPMYVFDVGFQHLRLSSLNNKHSLSINIRYDTLEEFNVDSKAEYSA